MQSKSSPVDDGSAISAANIVCDLSGETLVVHEENIDFSRVFHEEFLKTTREKVASLGMDVYIGGSTGKVRQANLFVTSITNLLERTY